MQIVGMSPKEIREQWPVEFGGRGAKGFFVRNVLVTPDELVSKRDEFNNTDVYTTCYHYGCDLDHSPQELSDIIKYGDFYIDFDSSSNSEGWDKVKKDVQATIKYFKYVFQLDSKNIWLFFSGNKGVHLIIPAESLGITQNINLHRIFKQIVEEISNKIPDSTLDTKIYDHRRLIRLNNSIHGSSKLYKVYITEEQLNTMDHEAIKVYASRPRITNLERTPYSGRTHAIYQGFENRIVMSYKPRSQALENMILTEIPSCVKKVLESELPEGNRNVTLAAVVSVMKQAGKDKDEIFDYLSEWNQKYCSPPLTDNEIKAIINSIYRGKYRFGCSSWRTISSCEGPTCKLYPKTPRIY